MRSTAKNYTDQQLLERRIAGILPEIDMAGHTFIVDWRLKELRAADAPHQRINLRNMAMDREGENYLCFYHVPSRSVIPYSGDVTALPPDTVMLEIPFELRLDPVGVAREYGLDDSFMLKDYPIQRELKAKAVPLEETGLPGLTEKNAQRPMNQKPAISRNRKKGKGM